MKVKRYNSGLRLVLEKNKNIDAVCFNLCVTVGSKDEDPKVYGISHFIEHMFFKSNEHLDCNQINKKLEELGVAFNAFTSISNTCYYFICLSEDFEQCLQTYSQMLTNTKFNKEELEKERNVIIEEYNAKIDKPDFISFRKAFFEMFKNTIYDHQVIGTLKTIKSISDKDLIEFKNKHYIPENVIISIEGNIGLKKAEKIIKKYLPHLFVPKQSYEYKKTEYIPIEEKLKFIITKKDDTQCKVTVLIGIGKEEDEDKTRSVFASILGKGKSSKLFTAVREEKGLVYSIGASKGSIGKNSYIKISFSTMPEKVKDVLKEIRNVLKKCAEGDMSTDDILKRKNRLRLATELSKEGLGNKSSKNMSDLLSYNKILSNKYILDKYNKVTLQEVIDVAKKTYTSKHYVVSCVGNVDKKDLYAFKDDANK